MTTSITTNADAPLTMRAIDAAHQRDQDTAEVATWRNPHWAQRAEASATVLAHLLGIPRAQIQVRPERTRAYGHWVWPALTITEPGGRRHDFTAAYNDPAQLLIIGPCPDCGGQVPLILLRHLADLGDLISGKPNPDAYRRRENSWSAHSDGDTPAEAIAVFLTALTGHSTRPTRPDATAGEAKIDG